MFRYGTTVFLSLRAGSLIETFWGYTAFPGVSLSVVVLVFAKQVRRERVFSTQRRAKALSTLADLMHASIGDPVRGAPFFRGIIWGYGKR